MSILYSQNFKTENNAEPLILTTGANYPRIKINSIASLISIESSNVLLTSKSIVETIWVPSSTIIPINRNNQIGFIQLETSPNKIQHFVWSFDPSLTNGGGAFTIRMNNKWDRGNINCSVVLSQRTNSTGNAVFTIRATAMDNGDSIDLIQGTMCNISIPMGTANTLYISNSSNYISGPIMTGNLNNSEENPTLYFEVNRNSSDALDTLAIDARLHGIELTYTLKEEI